MTSPIGTDVHNDYRYQKFCAGGSQLTVALINRIIKLDFHELLNNSDKITMKLIYEIISKKGDHCKVIEPMVEELEKAIEMRDRIIKIDDEEGPEVDKDWHIEILIMKKNLLQ